MTKTIDKNCRICNKSKKHLKGYNYCSISNIVVYPNDYCPKFEEDNGKKENANIKADSGKKGNCREKGKCICSNGEHFTQLSLL